MTEKTIFPKDFYWGAATASYQVEGGIENCDWAEAARNGRVPVCGRACDHYNHYEADFDIAKELGHNAHRFSIEWARIEPEEGTFDESAIEHYRAVLRALRARNIEPFVTLWHFTLPLWFSERGGFEQKDAPEIFARYCVFVTERLGDLCEHFSTMNESNVYATHGWLYAEWPPFKRTRILWKKLGSKHSVDTSFRNCVQYFTVAKHLSRAHNAAYKKIKAVHPHLQISLVKQVHVYGSNNGLVNKLKALLSTYYQNRRFMRRVEKHLDEIGLNYYHYTCYGDVQDWKKTDMQWHFAPEYIYHALHELARYKKPIFVSEAGLADHDDSDRAEYITKQIEGMRKALEDGIDVRGHMYWSLMDNYEWALGFEKKFGLVEVNYETLERTIRPSAYVYKHIIEQNGFVDTESEKPEK